MSIRQGSERFAQAMLLPINPAAIILLGVYTIVWGLWVLCPFWDVFTQASFYNALASLAPEEFWGVVAISCGAITTYGAVKRNYRALVNGALAAFWHWLMITIFYLIGNPLDTAALSAGIFAIYAAFVYLNIRVNFKDEKKMSSK